MQRVRWAVSIFAAAILASASTEAAIVTHFTTAEGREAIVLSGDVVPGDADKVIAAADQANSLGMLVSAVRLDSPGGSLVEGIKLAAAIQAGKVATVVVRGATCASACFIAFAAGAEKYVSYGARVGVHGASLPNSSGPVDAPAGTVAMAKIIKELGVPPAIIGQMVVTPHDQIVWLSPFDLQSMGVQMTGAPGEPPVALPDFTGTPPTPQGVSLPIERGQADPAMLRRAVAPLIRALTDCVAQQSLIDQDAVTEYRNGTFNSYVVRTVRLCPTFVMNLLQAYDRFDGEGQGNAFLNGPYASDLPRAVLKRIKLQMDDRLASLNRQAEDQVAREAEQKAAREQQQKADELLRQEEARKEEVDRQARMAEAEQKAAQARASAMLVEADAKLAATRLEAARQQQIGEARKVEALLVEKTDQCARQQLQGLLKSGESAEVLAGATMTICNREISDMLDGSVQKLRVERSAQPDETTEELYREKKRSETHDQVVALAVQAKAGVGAFAPAKVDATP